MSDDSTKQPEPGDGPHPWVLCFDGLCEPTNPSGVMAWGWVLWTDLGSKSTGPRDTGRGAKPAAPDNTNNVAEYLALYYGLLRARSLRRDIVDYPGIIVRGDSQLVVKQINGDYATNAPRLKAARVKCRDLLRELELCRVEWVPREGNGDADALSREAYKELVGTYPPERPARKGRAAG